jgi:hypothetical protein
MMLAWSFSARTLDEIERLLRALGKHRYVREVDLRLHWTVDRALADLSPFTQHAALFDKRRKSEPSLEIASRDPSLWRKASIDEIVAVLRAFWTPSEAAQKYKKRLIDALAETGLPPPFAASADEPPHPELVLLDWELLPVDELDADRHRGALEAMEEAGEEVNASAPVYQEGPILAAPELCDGAPGGELAEELFIWSDGPYSYSDYVFRGAAKVAKLDGPPVGYNDI